MKEPVPLKLYCIATSSAFFPVFDDMRAAWRMMRSTPMTLSKSVWRERSGSFTSGRSERTWRAWLIRILHNEYVSQVRRAARQGITIDWSQYESRLTCAPGQIEHLEIRDLVRALTSLPEEQRTAVLMIGLAKGDYYEVASACKVPVGTIRSRLSRGRKTLRALMSVAPLEPHIANRCARTA
jgi:RNA polymerase sigma factor (sigma-70 family)